MTGVARAFDEFEAALDDGDLQRAAGRADTIRQATPPPAALLDDLVAALETGNDPKARMLASVLDRRYDELEAAEEARLRRARLARGSETTVEEERALKRYASQVLSVSMERVGFLASVAGFSGDGDIDRDELRRAANRLRRREAGVDEIGSQAETAADGKELPGQLVVLSVGTADPHLISGMEARFTATVGNVGDQPVGDHTLRPTHDDLSITPASTSVAPGPDERLEREFRFTTDAEGTYDIAVRLESDGTTVDTERVSITVDMVPRTVMAAFDRNDSHLIETEELQAAAVAYHEQRELDALGGGYPTSEDMRQIITAWSNNELV